MPADLSLPEIQELLQSDCPFNAYTQNGKPVFIFHLYKKVHFMGETIRNFGVGRCRLLYV